MNPSSRYSGEVDVMVSRELSKFFFIFFRYTVNDRSKKHL